MQATPHAPRTTGTAGVTASRVYGRPKFHPDPAKLREIRSQRKITLRDLAALIRESGPPSGRRITHMTIHHAENGCPVTYETADLIAAGLGVGREAFEDTSHAQK